VSTTCLGTTPLGLALALLPQDAKSYFEMLAGFTNSGEDQSRRCLADHTSRITGSTVETQPISSWKQASGVSLEEAL
jgi:hypothetical protein